MHNALIAADRTRQTAARQVPVIFLVPATQMDEFVTGMEHRGNRDVNGQESCEFARPAWAFSLSRASTRHSGSGTGREMPCLRWPFTEYLWRGADVNGSLTTGPLRDEIPCGVRRSASQLWRCAIGAEKKRKSHPRIRNAELYPHRVPSVIVGQKWRNAPRLTHGSRQAPIPGAVSSPNGGNVRRASCPAGPGRFLTHDLDPRPRSSIPVSNGDGSLPAAPGLRLARFAAVTTISRR